MVTKIKKNKRRRKEKKELSRLLIANLIFFTVLILIGFILYSIYQSWRKSVWDGKHQLNFVIQAKQLMIFSFHPGDSILNILVVSPKTYIPVAHGFGKYEIGNIFKLGQLEKIGGGKLLSLSLQKFLATPIDGYIIQNQKSKIQNQNNSLEKGKLLSLYFSLLKKQTETNFTWWDLTRIFLKTNQLKPGQIKTINFGKTGAIEEKELADKSRILQFNYLRIDELSQELFSDKAILAEEASVIILNGSSFSGLANNIGRMVKNLGAELISTSDAQDNLKKSMIYYHDQKIRKNYTFIKLTKIFPMAEIKKNEQIEGDITFVLGEDFKSLY